MKLFPVLSPVPVSGQQQEWQEYKDKQQGMDHRRYRKELVILFIFGLIINCKFVILQVN